RALTQIALALEDQVKQAAAAEQAAQKETVAELRAKYVKELELALTEKGLIERRLLAETEQFSQQKESAAAELAKNQRDVANLQTDLQQALVELIELDGTLRRTQEKSAETEENLTTLQTEARQLASEKQDLEGRLQQSETNRTEIENAFKQLQAESRKH